MTSPFAQLRVVDLSGHRVGAQVSQFFADFGADVIQIEPPGGAEIRKHAAFAFWARGKRSIVLDLHQEADREVVRRLADHADVLIEMHRPGSLDALGLGYDELSSRNPRLVYTSISGWGQKSPYRDVAGYEGVIAAKLGLFHLFEQMSSHARPTFVNVPFLSFPASQVALHGSLTALIERQRSGLGQHVETNLVQAFTSLDTWAWFEHLVGQRWPEAFQLTPSFDPDGIPASPLTFMLLVGLTRDGRWLQFAAVAPRLFSALMTSLGLSWMFTDPEWKGLPALDDVAKRSELWDRMLRATNEKTLAEWQAIFDADSNVFAEQFRNGPVALEHPQLLHDGFTIDVTDVERGVVRQPGPLVKAATTPAMPTRSAPTLDADRAEVLALAGSVSPERAEVGERPDGLPLSGVTILELATLFAAPHGTTMLTDLGARVFKIEPLEGDRIRSIVPFPEVGGAKVMQGKESLAVDLATPEGIAIVREIASKVDVVVQGYRAGAMARLGLDYESIRALNPDVIYVNAPGYGVDGPYGRKPAYAPSIGAASGMPLANAGHTVPERPGLSLAEMRDCAKRLWFAGTKTNAQADGFAALGVSTAILLGIAARDLGAGGQELLSSMLNTACQALSGQAVTYAGAPPEPAPDDELRGLTALYQIYDAAHGYVFLAAPTDRDWSRLVRALSRFIDLAADPRFTDRDLRAANDAALAEALANIFVSQSAAAWEAELLAQHVACVAVTDTSIEEVMYDPAFGEASGYVTSVVHPIFDEHLRLAPYVQFSRSATQALPAVLCGQHTDAILTELGRDAEAIADLRGRKIVA